MKFFTSKATSPSEVASSSVAAPSFENVAHYHPFEEEEDVLVLAVENRAHPFEEEEEEVVGLVVDHPVAHAHPCEEEDTARVT